MTAGPEEIAHAVERLRHGGLVAFPTETVYGLGADALNPEAIARVFALKGRPANNPLIVHVADVAMARTAVDVWTDEADRLAGSFWPGPLTLVLPKADAIPDAVMAGGSTIAVRCPAHHIALSLLAAIGRPLVGPSANPSGRVSPTTAEHVRDAFTEDEVYVLDGGPCRAGIESTVVSLVDRPARVLRRGVISADEISEVLGEPVLDGGAGAVRADDGPMRAPGQLPVHYAPSAPAIIADTRAVADLVASQSGAVAVLSHTGLRVPSPHRAVLMPADALGYAARLYAALREADALHPALIVIERPPATGPIWDAIADRLARATAPRH